jgi:hypothetical protein
MPYNAFLGLADAGGLTRKKFFPSGYFSGYMPFQAGGSVHVNHE